MKYDEMIEGLAEITGQPIEVVKDILYAIPDILLDMKVGEKTITPLGMFYMYRTKLRTVVMPDGVTEVMSRPVLMVKLKPGNRMKWPV